MVASSDSGTGSLTSAQFTIRNNCINFLISGGNHPGETCIDLLINGERVLTATGGDSDILKWSGWNVARWKGRRAQIRIVDHHAGNWGHINVDHILFSDVLLNQDREHANWVDWGSDFYAARVFRDYDGVERSPLWMAWMSNWQYARNVPTSWGKGAESIPRNLQLVRSPKGYQIAQQPLSALKGLRGHLVKIDRRTVNGIVKLNEFRPQTNAYELEAVFDLRAANQQFGLNLCVGGSNKVVLGYDAMTSTVFLDRRASRNVSFSPSFPNIVSSPMPTRPDAIKFHIFVDQSSIEVFVNDGQIVLTSLIFPEPGDLGLDLFSSGGFASLRSLSAWPLESIWQNQPPT